MNKLLPVIAFVNSESVVFIVCRTHKQASKQTSTELQNIDLGKDHCRLTRPECCTQNYATIHVFSAWRIMTELWRITYRSPESSLQPPRLTRQESSVFETEYSVIPRNVFEASSIKVVAASFETKIAWQARFVTHLVIKEKVLEFCRLLLSFTDIRGLLFCCEDFEESDDSDDDAQNKFYNEEAGPNAKSCNIMQHHATSTLHQIAFLLHLASTFVGRDRGRWRRPERRGGWLSPLSRQRKPHWYTWHYWHWNPAL